MILTSDLEKFLFMSRNVNISKLSNSKNTWSLGSVLDCPNPFLKVLGHDLIVLAQTSENQGRVMTNTASKILAWS